MPDRHVETHTLLWNGIRIEIRYCPSWSEILRVRLWPSARAS